VPELTDHPAIADSYLASLWRVEAALRGPEGAMAAQAFAAVRNLVDSMIVTPNGAGAAPLVEVVGDLARLLAPDGPLLGAEWGRSAPANTPDWKTPEI